MAQSPRDDAPEEQVELNAKLGDAARGSALGRLAGSDDGTVTAAGLLGAIGGVRGIVEATLPGLLFVAVYAIAQDIVPAAIAPIALALVFIGARALAKTTVTPAVGGLVAVVASAVVAMLSGRDEDYFLPGIIINAAYGGGMLLSALITWPLIGLAAGFLMNDGIAWRKDRQRFRAMQWLTVMWAGLFAARLAVQLPLYFTDQIALLGGVKLAMGLPLFAPLLVVTWLVVRAAYRRRD